MEEREDVKKLRRSAAKEDAGLSVGRYLTGRLGFTKTQVKRMKFRANGICINGVRARVTQILEVGDIIEVTLEESAVGSWQLEETEGELEILYEDADLIGVWKPAGLVVHPAHGHYSDTLSNRLHGYFRKKGGAVRIRSIGRLDADTSGILIFAKNEVAAERLWRQRESGAFRKEYMAWCEGSFPEEAKLQEQIVDAPIRPMEGALMKMCVAADGKPAVTYYRVMEEREDAALVRLHLGTGRTHQIRVHMAWLGHPLVGDALYGNGEAGKTYAKLCAYRAELRQPFSGERIVMEIPFI